MLIGHMPSIDDITGTVRSAVGVGLAITTPMGGRFEFNYCWPIRAYLYILSTPLRTLDHISLPGDKVPKWQLGVSIAFS